MAGGCQAAVSGADVLLGAGFGAGATPAQRAVWDGCGWCRLLTAFACFLLMSAVR